jgi:hypothetical protein
VTLRIECPECSALVEAERFTCELRPYRVSFYCPECDEEVTVASVADGGAEDDDEEASPGADEGEAGAPGEKTSGPAAALVPELDRDGGLTEVVLGQLWELVTEDFAEGARHDAFIAACEAQNKLAFAAARYREWLADHPDDEVAGKRQKQLLALAQVRALAASSRQTKEKDPLRKALSAFLVMVMLLALVIFAAPILLRSARGCRATQPDPAVLRRPSLPMVNNLRRRGDMGGYRGLTPRRHRRPGQLVNLKPPPMRPAPMRPAPTRPAPLRPAPMQPATMPPR